MRRILKLSDVDPSLPLRVLTQIIMQSWMPFVPESASTLSGEVDALYFYHLWRDCFLRAADIIEW